jgi:uncharacterized protein YuzE
MKLRIDETTNALYLRLTESAIVESEEVHPGIVLDFDERGQIVGIEILRLSEQIPRLDVKQLLIERT